MDLLEIDGGAGEKAPPLFLTTLAVADLFFLLTDLFFLLTDLFLTDLFI